MPSTKSDPASPQMISILECLDEKTPYTMYEIAEMLGSSYWTLYPYFRKLESMGIITAGPFRKDKKKTFTKTDMSRTPKIHVSGLDSPPVEVFRIAAGATISLKNGTELGRLVNAYPYMILKLYSLASSVEAGHAFDKSQYQSIRKEMVTLRNRLENTVVAINELLAHPVMSGDSSQLVDTLMNDDNSPLDREKILNLMKECEINK